LPLYLNRFLKVDATEETEERATAMLMTVRMKFRLEIHFIVEVTIFIVFERRSLQTKGLQRILPKGGMWGFFGWQTVDAASHKVIVFRFI